MIISDLTYLEVTSEAGSVVGGTNEKPKKKVVVKNSNILAAKVTQKSGDIKDVDIKVIKSKDVDIVLNTGNSIEVTQR